MGTELQGRQPYRYVQLANTLQDKIEQGVLSLGTRIPSTRRLAQVYNVSINTVLQAQKQLELRGYLSAVPRSGFYVTMPQRNLSPPNPNTLAGLSQTTTESKGFKQAAKPTLVRNQGLVMDLIAAAHAPDVVSLGAALPHKSFLPSDALRLHLARCARRQPHLLTDYSFPPGIEQLRKTLANKMLRDGCQMDMGDIVVTSGCHDAILLALKATTQPGDIVALESPTYYGLLQALESMQLKALELPSTTQGIDLDALTQACNDWPIKACILVANFSNPMGCLMSNQKKRAILDVLHEHDIPLIEDDVYGDLAFSGERPASMASLDQDDNVIYCCSFSKTLAPGMRIGWVASRRYAEKLSYLKFAQSLGVAPLEQVALADYLEYGHYQRHLRQLQRRLSKHIQIATRVLREQLNADAIISQPLGGFVIWVALPPHVNTYELYQGALCNNISIAPGRVFSTDERYEHCFRINCGLPVSMLEPALIQLSKLIQRQL